MRHVEKDVVLRTLDQHWRDHLAAMDYLRQGIHLRGYAQKDYRYEYKREAFELFTAMLERVKFDAVSTLSRIEVRTQEQIDREEAERRERLMRALQAQHAEAQSALGAGEALPEPAAAPAAGWRRGRLRPVRAPRPPRRRRSCARCARWGATNPAPAARGASTSIAMGRSTMDSEPGAESTPAPAATLRVVAAVMYDAAGRVLIAQRPAGKFLAGKWEFPGGKLEPGESAEAGLARELAEELGVQLQSCRPLLSLRHDYPHARVELATLLVERYAGEPAGREGQALKWVRPAELYTEDLLPADRPIVDRLQATARSEAQ